MSRSFYVRIKVVVYKLSVLNALLVHKSIAINNLSFLAILIYYA